MAINKLIENSQGVETNHHVFSLEFNNIGNRVVAVWHKYVNATKFNNKKNAVEVTRLSFALDNVPSTIKVKLKNALDELEAHLLATMPDMEGGTQVKDNGNPLA